MIKKFKGKLEVSGREAYMRIAGIIACSAWAVACCVLAVTLPEARLLFGSVTLAFIPWLQRSKRVDVWPVFRILRHIRYVEQ